MPNPQSSIANILPPTPAPLGNTRSVRHGAYSERIVGPRAAEIVEATFAANPHLDRDRDTPTVCRYAQLRARHERLSEWLNSQPDSVFENVATGSFHRVYERCERWERMLDAQEAHLCIAPLTRARLGLVVAETFDLATAMADDAQREQVERPPERRELEAGEDG
jgi:hypothetical protein